MKQRTSNRIFLALALVFGVLIGSVGTGAVLAYQGHMFAAKDDLNAAKNQLNMAERDKSGHRTNAVNLINQAIGEVNAGIAAGAQ